MRVYILHCNRIIVMKIAIIGSGVSGLVSAYLLAPKHEITIYEKADRLGGHAHTQTITTKSRKIAVDNGFMVFNPGRYPNLVGLLKELGVESRETKMSFSVDIEDEISYRGDFPNGLFADRKNIFSIRFWKFLKEIIKFRKAAKKEIIEKNFPNEKLSEFIERYSLSKDLTNWFLYPMLSAIWSVKETNIVDNFPALSTFIFLNNHKLLDNTQPKWRTIVGGSIEYVTKIESVIKQLGATINLGFNISKVVRNVNGVEITANEITEQYDYLIVATHADSAIDLISDISKQEKSALEKFSYTTSRTVLHEDSSVFPKNKRLLASWNYMQSLDDPLATFTYSMNILQHIPKATPVYVTLNPHIDIDPNKTFAVEEYSHPQYNNDSLEGQKKIVNLQGKQNIFFVGAHLGYGFHEDGIESAVNVANLLGIKPSWQK